MGYACVMGGFSSPTIRVEPEANWQMLPTPRVAAESDENTEPHGTAANVPLISCEDELPENSTVALAHVLKTRVEPWTGAMMSWRSTGVVSYDV